MIGKRLALAISVTKARKWTKNTATVEKKTTKIVDSIGFDHFINQ